MSKFLPQALGATGLVVAGPVVAVWALRAWQLVGSTALAVVIGVVLSLAVSFAGSAYWANRERSRDVLFSELMIWGWLRRWRAEHKLTAALERLAEQTTAGLGREGTPQLAMLTELAEALEAGDPYTRNHSRRVARYASMIAERLGLPAEDVDRIRTAAMLHDVGKVRTPIEVLHKPGRLTDEEYAIIKAHPVDGARLVEALGDDRLTAIGRHHHERLDGRGYPDGLSGNEIPFGARIISVADTFDAITSARAYRPASPHRKALDILIKEAGTQLDGDAVRAFRACYTGRRPIALWMTVLAFPQRLSTSLGNGAAASAASIPKVIMAASTVAVVGGAAASARPLMVLPAAPQAAATVAASAAAQSSARPVAATAVPSSPAALGAKLTSTSVRTREQKLTRRPGSLSRRFPMSAAAGHRVGSSAAHTSPSPATTPSSSTPVSTPVSAPSSNADPVSTPTSSDPVSTVASAPATTTPTTPTTTPDSSGSGTGPAPTDTSGKDHGKGSDTSGKGQDQGTATTKTKTKTKTTTSPTTTTAPPPEANPPGNGNGNGNGSGNGNSHAGGNGNGNGDATTSAGGNGNGNGNAGGNGNGAGNAGGNGNGAASGTSNAGGNGNGNAGGNGNGAASGTSNAGGNGHGNGNGHGETATTPSAG